MKKRLYFTNTKGFILPLSLFVLSLVFIFIMANIYVYQQEGTMTFNHIEQIKGETLIQMGIEKFKEENPLEEDTTKYTFPYGTVNIKSTFDEEKDNIILTITAETDQNTTLTSSYTIRVFSEEES